MKPPECEQLDDYLLGWLSPAEAIAFEHHLLECSDCRGEQALQRSIDRLLAEDCSAIDALPAGLVSRIEDHVCAARRRRRTRLISFASAVAASALALIVIWGSVVSRWDRAAFEAASAPGQTEPSANAVAGAGSDSDSSTRLELRDGKPVLDDFVVTATTGASAKTAAKQLTPSTQVTLADPSAGIVLDCKTRDPDITMVWIYPAAKSTVTERVPIHQ